MKKTLVFTLTLLTLIATCILFFSCDENIIKDKLSERPTESATEYTKTDFSQGLEFLSNNDGTCSVASIGTCTDEHIVIPSTSPDGDTVTGISDGAFYNCKSIKSVILSPSVKSIGNNAFEFCASLESVTLQNGVESIGDMAFHCCYSLQSAFIPESVETIGTNPFLTCKNLKCIAVSSDSSDFYVKNNCLIDKKNSTLICATPDWQITDDLNITTIGAYAFSSQAHSLTCTIPEGVKVIEEYAFGSFFTLHLPSTIEAIDENAFSKTSSSATIRFEGSEYEWTKVSKPDYWSHSNYTVFFAKIPQKFLHGNEFYNVWQFVRAMYAGEKDLAFDYNSSMGYCLKDLNADGTDELILMAKGKNTDDYRITAICEMGNNSIVILQKYDYTDEISVWIDANGCIHYEDIYTDMYHKIYRINSNYEMEFFAGYNYERSTTSHSYNYFYNGINGSTSNMSWLHEKYTDCIFYYDAYGKIYYMENAVGIMFTPLTSDNWK